MKVMEVSKEDNEIIEAENSANSLDDSLKSLGRITRALSLLSLTVLGGTSLNLIFSIFSFIFFNYYISFRSERGYYSGSEGHYYSTLMQFFITLTWMVCFAVIIAVYFYESKRKRGEVLFEEISDELEWYVIGQDKKRIAAERPKIDARVSLRSFVKTTDLPFIPSKYGPAFYLIINLSFPLFVSFFMFRI